MKTESIFEVGQRHLRPKRRNHVLWPIPEAVLALAFILMAVIVMEVRTIQARVDRLVATSEAVGRGLAEVAGRGCTPAVGNPGMINCPLQMWVSTPPPSDQNYCYRP